MRTLDFFQSSSRLTELVSAAGRYDQRMTVNSMAHEGLEAWTLGLIHSSVRFLNWKFASRFMTLQAKTTVFIGGIDKRA